MDRRRIIQQLIVLLLILLLGFWGYQKRNEFKTRVERTGPGSIGKFSDAPLSPNQSAMEKAMGKLTSPTEQEKPVLRPIQHSSIVNNGTYQVFGEVANIGRTTGRNIKARVIFKSPSWKRRLDTIEVPIDQTTLAPGQTSKFRVSLRGVPPTNVGSYVLMMVADPPTTREISKNTWGLVGFATDAELALRKRIGLFDDGSRKSRGGSRDEGAPNWITLLLLLVGSGWSGWRFYQWRQR